MSHVKIYWIIVSAAVILLFVHSMATAAEPGEELLVNGDFSKTVEGRPAGWDVSTEEAQVSVQRLGGEWMEMTIPFNSGKYSTIRFYLAVIGGSIGSVWFDNVHSQQLDINNPSFEQVTAEGALVGWGQDNVNVTIFSDESRASAGGRSARITYQTPNRQISRISQEIPVTPNTDYEISFDCLVGDDYLGAIRPNVYAVNDDGSLGPHLAGPTSNTDTVIAERERCNHYLCTMDLAGGHAELSQAISARADANLEAAVEIMTTDLQGEVTLRVDDADTGRLLGQATESEKDSSWHRLRVRVETPSPQVRMRIIGTGTGQVRLDHARLGPPLIIPPVKHVRWFPASENFSLSGTLTVSVQGRVGPALGGALDMLAQDLDKLNIKLMRLKQGVGQLQIDIGPEYGVQGEGAEAYSLLVNPLGIWVQAKDERGAFYGLMTLLQLIKSSEDGKAVAIAGEITDYPDMPMRGVFLTGGSITGKGLEEDLQVMARLRMNTAIASLDTYHYKTDPKAKDRIQQFLQACRRFNLEPIPLQCTLGWGYYVIEHNPNLAEGTYITGEKLTLNGEEPVELAHRNVLRTELTDIVLQSVDGKTTYKPGVDYRIIPGEIKFADHQFWADVKPFAVARIATGSIPDGATVLASYDAVVQTGKTRYGYCPTEPETRRIMGEWITNVAKDWPFHYNFISMDELHGRFCTDSRCLNSGKSPAQVLAEHLHFLDEKAHEGNPDLRLMMWGDAVDPFDKAGSVGVADIGPLLPKDIIQCVWGYEANTPQARGFKGVEYFSNLGITSFVCPWYDFTNIRQWAQVVAEARRRGWPCLGLVDSVWYSNADGVEEAAICSWEIPKKGDPRYVPLTIE